MGVAYKWLASGKSQKVFYEWGVAYSRGLLINWGGVTPPCAPPPPCASTGGGPLFFPWGKRFSGKRVGIEGCSCDAFLAQPLNRSVGLCPDDCAFLPCNHGVGDYLDLGLGVPGGGLLFGCGLYLGVGRLLREGGLPALPTWNVVTPWDTVVLSCSVQLVTPCASHPPLYCSACTLDFFCTSFQFPFAPQAIFQASNFGFSGMFRPSLFGSIRNAFCSGQSSTRPDPMGGQVWRAVWGDESGVYVGSVFVDRSPPSTGVNAGKWAGPASARIVLALCPCPRARGKKVGVFWTPHPEPWVFLIFRDRRRGRTLTAGFPPLLVTLLFSGQLVP